MYLPCCLSAGSVESYQGWKCVLSVVVGAEPHMPELPMGFLEHAQWQHNGMHAKRLADLEWWFHQLQGAPLQPLLTTDIPRSGKANIGQNPGNTVQVGSLVSPACGALACSGLLQEGHCSWTPSANVSLCNVAPALRLQPLFTGLLLRQ